MKHKTLTNLFMITSIVTLLLAVLVLTLSQEPTIQLEKAMIQTVIYLQGTDSVQQKSSSDEDDAWNWELFRRSRWDDGDYSEDALGKVIYERAYFLYPDGLKMEIEHEIPPKEELIR